MSNRGGRVITMKSEENEILEQYDLSTDEYLYKVEDKYAPLVGVFLFRFSELEHTLNLEIAELISDRTHEPGYVVIENLTMTNKIQLFYKFVLRYVSEVGKDKDVDKLKKLKDQLIEINSFRNKVVHANWHTINKLGMVRTKISVDGQGGYVLFKKVQILPKTISHQIKEIEKLTLELESFAEIMNY